MVIKTETCHFTEYRMYPGRGSKFVAKDGKTFMFISHKAASLHMQKKKAVKLTWSQQWRRMNKKGQAQEGRKKKGKRAVKFQKAIVGMSLDDIKKKKAQRTEIRAATQAGKDAAAKKHKANAAKKPSGQKNTKGNTSHAQGAGKVGNKGHKAAAPKKNAVKMG